MTSWIYTFSKIGQSQTLFIYIRRLFQQQFHRKIVDFSGIQTRIIGEEGKHADHHHSPHESQPVTILGKLLDFGQLFKAFGKNEFAKISYILKQFL